MPNTFWGSWNFTKVTRLCPKLPFAGSQSEGFSHELVKWWQVPKTFIIAWVWGQAKGGGLLFSHCAMEYYNRKMGLFYTSVYGLEWIKKKKKKERWIIIEWSMHWPLWCKICYRPWLEQKTQGWLLFSKSGQKKWGHSGQKKWGQKKLGHQMATPPGTQEMLR